jgi:transcriptional regulator with XRE-family HTH domain
VVDERQFFRTFGQRVRKLRKAKGYTQEDMIGFGFSARHWQQIEAGRPITVRTLLRICDTLGVRAAELIEGLDRGIYRK